MKKKAKTSKSSPPPKKPITRFHFTHKLDTDRRDLRSPRQPPCERVNGADTAALHIGTTLPSGAARTRAVRKIVVLFVAEYDCTA